MAKRGQPKKTEQEKDTKDELDTTLASIEKKHGKGAIMYLGDSVVLDVPVISTGSLNLNTALGIGGVPRGRIVEIIGAESAGKTSLALSIIAQAQKSGKAAFIDAEHALDKQWAQKIGVNLKHLLFSQPDYGEQALDIVATLVESGKVDVIVVDSVAALTPKAEIDGEMGQANMGLQARLMSQAMRKLTASVSKSNTCLIFINQIRMKIGVMFGCLHGSTKVLTEQGGVEISKIVKNRIKTKVWTLNEQSKKFELNPILDYHINGQVNNRQDFLHIKCQGVDTKNGVCGVVSTSEHKFLTRKGWKKARNLTCKDYLITKYSSIVNKNLADFLWGTLVADSHIAKVHSTSAIVFQDNVNEGYVQWKVNMLNKALNFNKVDKKYVSEFTYELSQIKEELGYRNPIPFLKKHFSRLGLALWIMDDGSFCSKGRLRYTLSVKRLKHKKITLIKTALLLDRLGYTNRYRTYDGSIVFDKEGSLKIAEDICVYVPSCMQYKLPKQFKNKYKDFRLDYVKIQKTAYNKILSISFAHDRLMRDKNKYDLTILNNSNYLAGNIHNGIIVHNSPETTPGGRALKFYSSVRIDVRRIKSITMKEKNIGNIIRAKVIKNKLAAPFEIGNLYLFFDEGFSAEYDTLLTAIEKGIVKKSGSWLSYKEKNIAQGVEQAKEYLKANPKVLKEIVEEINNGKDEQEKN